MNFNPHSHEGSDASKIQNRRNSSYFNPHSHEGSDAQRAAQKAAEVQFQSTLPRRERLKSAMSFESNMAISIHTPTKGATNINVLF